MDVRADGDVLFGDLQNPGNPYYARTDDIYKPDFTRPTGWVSDDTLWQRAAATMP